jgi:uncharacterized metal-binding protein YceD (DUF177 family)
MPGTSKYDDRKGCQHQFFAVRDLSYYPMSMVKFGDGMAVDANLKAGTLVMCARCGQRRELWEDGQINRLPVSLDRDGNSIGVVDDPT